MENKYLLRPAKEEDSGIIHALIKEGKINPAGLDWRRFLVAVTPNGDVIGCGQIKQHGNGSYELASLAVTQNWRGRGVANAIIHQLLSQHHGPLYLMCRSGLGEMYAKYGFRSLAEDEMPRYFRRVSKVAGIVDTLMRDGEYLLVMGRGI
jgi:N-acetylglutamate synthase-like GNAT family acetyltransferase